jgi:hypothetical protein
VIASREIPSAMAQADKADQSSFEAGLFTNERWVMHQARVERSFIALL